MQKDNRINPTVCVFDSGIGGLNLLYECVRRLPHVDFTYFADNYNVPYGNLSKDGLLEKTCGIFDKIARLNPAAAVVACNTVTAQCVSVLRARYPFKIVGIQPAVKPAAAQGDCLVLATRATATSGAVGKLVEDYGHARTRLAVCPDLAEYIENEIFSLDKNRVISMLPKLSAKEVVLGCTHYPFIRNTVAEFYGCQVWDGIVGTADHLREILGRNDHATTTAQKIQFMSGNFDKNSRIFKILLQNGRDYFDPIKKRK